MISSALVIATGDPNPATPSSNAPKQKPMITSTTRRSSGRRRRTQSQRASKRPDETVRLNNRSALTTIHMIGQSANTAPAAALSSATGAGSFQTAMASPRPIARPAREASQAARLSTPMSSSTVAIGRAATRKESPRLPATGLRS